MSKDREDDFERGLKNRRAVLGDAWVDGSLARATAFNADFQDLITRYAWHSIWGRPGLPHDTRRLLVLAMTMTAARWEEFELHCGAAIRGGVPLAAIRETLMQGAIYAGVPAANTAFKLTLEILRKEGLLDSLAPAAPLTADRREARHHTFSAPSLQVAVQAGAPDATATTAAAAGAPVVLAHALGLDLSMWDGFAAELGAGRVSGSSHPVLRYDHRGQGGSAVPAGPYALADLVDDAARLLREWGRAPVVWVGVSMGAMVGMGLALAHPELVSKLVLAHSTAAYPAEAAAAWAARIDAVQRGGMAAVADTVLERYLHPAFRAAHPAAAQALRQQLLRADAAGYAASCAAVADVASLGGPAALAALRCPTLVISGAHDVGATPAMGRALAAAIAGARFELIDDASHLSVLETPATFARLVGGFIGAA